MEYAENFEKNFFHFKLVDQFFTFSFGNQFKNKYIYLNITNSPVDTDQHKPKYQVERED